MKTKPPEWLDRLLSILYPPRCVCCGCVLPAGERLCDACAAEAVRIQPPACPQCGCRVEDCSGKHGKAPYEAIVAPFYYEGAVRAGIHRFKFRDSPQSAGFFAREMEACIRKSLAEPPFELITCVPMRPEKEKERGYNQSALLAQELAALLGLPADCHTLRKLFDTPAQHELAGEERRGNVFGVFEAARPEAVAGKTVLLCDDVKTTGATLEECTKVLQLAGAKAVFCACIAITRKKENQAHEPAGL